MKRSLLTIWCVCMAFALYAQDQVADNMLLFQRRYGGWPKHYEEKKIDYNRNYSDKEKATIQDENNRNDATIDNQATTKEIRYLVKAYQQTGNKTYLQAAEKGIRYLLDAQYRNGGWPQFYPDLSSYRHNITYNDNAMVNVMNLLYDVSTKANGMGVIDSTLMPKITKAIQRGIDCILQTQIVVKKKPTVWCAQHDENTLRPANARKFELASYSGAESVGIVEFLMRLPNPSDAVKKSIAGAVDWLNEHKLAGWKMEDFDDPTQPGGRNRRLVQDSSSVIWARFYDLDNVQPFVCGRDGIARKNLEDIEPERRMGYGWYGNWAKKLLEKEYPEWQKKNGNTITK